MSESIPVGTSTATLGHFMSSIVFTACMIGCLRVPLAPVPSRASTTTLHLSDGIVEESRAISILTDSVIALTAHQFLTVDSSRMSLGSPTSTTVTWYPRPAKCLAATIPSPPFLPVPEYTATSAEGGNRCAISSATVLPAFSMSCNVEMPRYSELRSSIRDSREVTSPSAFRLIMDLRQNPFPFRLSISVGIRSVAKQPLECFRVRTCGSSGQTRCKLF